MEECERAEKRESDREFIDDTEYDGSVTDYYSFTNVGRSYEDALEDFDWNQGPENYCDKPTNRTIDDFNSSEQRVDRLKWSLVNLQGADNPDSFFYTTLYALRY